ncbi:hypothetical protein [Saccharothrix syringae]|uniref:Uncharacterized protein n=1 Tax=Saccharothrix syringae TaxID=103733 RepID=A0A5Q0H1H6_SACSY|nr:hypothetical protein [Saccharothrix syringae]QFZ20106.1 hypothetical protein EKG83_24200 [Saccharothrix syringae]
MVVVLRVDLASVLARQVGQAFRVSEEDVRAHHAAIPRRLQGVRRSPVGRTHGGRSVPVPGSACPAVRGRDRERV